MKRDVLPLIAVAGSTLVAWDMGVGWELAMVLVGAAALLCQASKGVKHVG